MMNYDFNQWLDIGLRLTSNHRHSKLELKSSARNFVEYIFEIWDNDFFCRQRPRVPVVNIQFSKRIYKYEKPVHIGVADSESINTSDNIDCPYKESDSYFSRDDMIKASYVILGRFSPDYDSQNKLGTITLYTAAIAEFCNSNNYSYTVLFWSTLAHEAFHAFHYSMFKDIGIQGRWNNGSIKNNREIVKESLASLVEYTFLKNCGITGLNLNEANNVTNYLKKTWGLYDVEDWPYSGALGLSKVANQQALIETLLKKSIYDWKTASSIIKTSYYLSNSEISKAIK